ncbi:gliding motility-associated ABC transporter substrate-binding protein GldG [Draconibacterium sp. IB214405]|uniref:gliding motility-associated ABC transporter substrate-binding protein GldG n=1 Tax=Draconibacterium sp. IB214405 TaxID=3097352 RepID=UPI002A1856A8|nr:gliding motility-associated ABC transporter substrate-binding protein GldG [Draconibacterium sp. IB214405]MDX8340630.1 gliding motility-associated ABC transporter substrate-binding protein GldG [Draconibacterium sp. IB214405]
MYSLFKKEIKTFLGSLIGYLAILVFLLVTGLFLWIFPGNYNIPDNNYATLQGLFTLAPWLYLFLVPAITMRMFADEKRSGTIEILLTRPLGDLQLVLAKFLAGLVLVVLSLLPTLLYFLSVYLLGNPVGSIDTGATWGSFMGLFFLATIYVAIGIFASSLTDNQIVSFIFGMSLSFIFYLGFEFVASSEVPYLAEQLFSWLSINDHYLSISRGVVDMRDILYFIGMAFLFLYGTTLILRKGKLRKTKAKVRAVVIPVVVLLVLAISSNFLYRIDLTAEKRYSLSDVSKQMVSGLEGPVEVELYLSGELEAGLRKIQNEVLEKIAVLNAYSSSPIRVRIFNPYSIGNIEKQEEFITDIVNRGVPRINFGHKTEQGVSSRFIFPGAIIRYQNKELAVNFLKNNPYTSYENNFNHSVETIEFELVNAFHKLIRKKKSVLAFLQGHDEANQYEVADIARTLSSDFEIDMLEAADLDGSDVDILVIANPKKEFPETSKIAIDQYLMKGGKLMWLVDPVQVSLDSLSKGFQTYSFPNDMNIGDQLFRYGVRLNYELLQDVNCIQIRVNTAAPGNAPRYTLHPWYYSPLLTPNDNHPISRNLNWVKAEFVSSLDTVSANSSIQKEVILSTSPYARRIKAPSSVSLGNINNPPARELFTQSDIPVGVLLEGVFTSNYKNRMVENYGYSSAEIITESQPTQMIVIADGGMITNKVNYSTNPPKIQELGFDEVSGQVFGNKEFLVNAISYLNDKQGIMELRGRSLKLRLLDKVKLREEAAFWKWLNVLLPLLLITVFALVYNLVRKYKYNRS